MLPVSTSRRVEASDSSLLLVSSTSGAELFLSPHVLDIDPYVAAYIIAVVIRLAQGSATVALVTAALALLAPKGRGWHVYAGRVFTAGMALVFATAVPITVPRLPNSRDIAIIAIPNP